jgi:hypothetical protein
MDAVGSGEHPSAHGARVSAGCYGHGVKRICRIVLCTLLVGVLAPAGFAHGAPGHRERCAPRGDRVVVADAIAEIYRATERPGIGSAHLGETWEFRGCTVHSKHTFKLGVDPTQSVCGSPAGCEGVTHMVLARKTVAYESFSTEPYNIERTEAVTKEYIVTRNLSTGHVVHRVPTGAGLEEGVQHIGVGSVTSIVVKPDGSAAWIAEDDDRTVQAEKELGRRVTYYDVYDVDRSGEHELASGTEIAPHSLIRAGSLVRWHVAGKAYSAELN